MDTFDYLKWRVPETDADKHSLGWIIREHYRGRPLDDCADSIGDELEVFLERHAAPDVDPLEAPIEVQYEIASAILGYWMHRRGKRLVDLVDKGWIAEIADRLGGGPGAGAFVGSGARGFDDLSDAEVRLLRRAHLGAANADAETAQSDATAALGITEGAYQAVVYADARLKAGGPIVVQANKTTNAPEESEDERDGRKRFDDREVAHIRKRAALGEPHTSIAADLPVSRESVRKIVDGDSYADAPGEIRGEDYAPSPKTWLDDDEVRRLREEAKPPGGADNETLADTYGIADTTVYRIVRGATRREADGPIAGEDYPTEARRWWNPGLEAIVDIRERVDANEPTGRIADDYDTTPDAVRRVARGDIWPNQPGPITDVSKDGRHSACTYTDADVEDIRIHYATTADGYKTTSKRFGCSSTYVRNLVRGEVRPNAPGPILGDDYTREDRPVDLDDDGQVDDDGDCDDAGGRRDDDWADRIADAVDGGDPEAGPDNRRRMLEPDAVLELRRTAEAAVREGRILKRNTLYKRFAERAPVSKSTVTRYLKGDHTRDDAGPILGRDYAIGPDGALDDAEIAELRRAHDRGQRAASLSDAYGVPEDYVVRVVQGETRIKAGGPIADMQPNLESVDADMLKGLRFDLKVALGPEPDRHAFRSAADGHLWSPAILWRVATGEIRADAGGPILGDDYGDLDAE